MQTGLPRKKQAWRACRTKQQIAAVLWDFNFEPRPSQKTGDAEKPPESQCTRPPGADALPLSSPGEAEPPRRVQSLQGPGGPVV